MKAIEILKQKAESIDLFGKYYLTGLNSEGYQVTEIDGSQSYCDDCIKEAVKELNEELQSDERKFYKNHDCYGSFCKVSYAKESSPEDDDFCSCYDCSREIYTGVLFTSSQEIDHWIEEEINISELSESDSYRLYTCLTDYNAQENHPEKVEALRMKIEKL